MKVNDIYEVTIDSVDINGIPHNLSFKYQIQSQSSLSRLVVNVYDETDNIILTNGLYYDIILK